MRFEQALSHLCRKQAGSAVGQLALGWHLSAADYASGSLGEYIRRLDRAARPHRPWPWFRPSAPLVVLRTKVIKAHAHAAVLVRLARVWRWQPAASVGAAQPRVLWRYVRKSYFIYCYFFYYF